MSLECTVCERNILSGDHAACDVQRERDALRAENERLRGLGEAVNTFLDSMDENGYVTREAQERLRQALRDAWMDLP